MGTCTESGYEVPFSIPVEVATTWWLHVSKGDGLEHSNTTAMMSHVFNIDSIQVLTHGSRSSSARLRVYEQENRRSALHCSFMWG